MPSELLITSQSFSYTGSVQYFTVPTDVFKVTVELHGASGGRGYSSGVRGLGGKGMFLMATYDVVPGAVWCVFVGGTSADATSSAVGPAGYNGGQSGNAGGGGFYGGGGGNIFFNLF